MNKRSSVRLALALCWAAVLPLAWPAPSLAQYDVSVSVGAPPPPLPVYFQPSLPEDGYLWIPGYWAWNGYDYFWIPAAWVRPPEPGLLCTPGYWAWNGAAYVYNPGYWGPTVGYYGGVDYGYGYYGRGFAGGYWRNGGFSCNSAVTNIGAAYIANVYVHNVAVDRNVANVSYNGGPGGLTVQPTPAERAALHQPHIAPTPAQTHHFEAARADGALTATANHGVPPLAATPAAGRFHGPRGDPGRSLWRRARRGRARLAALRRGPARRVERACPAGAAASRSFRGLAGVVSAWRNNRARLSGLPTSRPI
jgi:hypothetical protein